MAHRPPDAFLSYTRFDDRRGDISAFRKHLEHAVQEVTGEPFEIFQDVDGIGLGQQWSGKLDEMLEQVRFFIPIVTPSYLKSQACRDELEKFLRAEADRGRDDLVLPIYYIDSDSLENTHLRAADRLAAAIHQRQRHDWRPLRFSSISTKTVKTAFYKLAREIARARRRSMPEVTATPISGKAQGLASLPEQPVAVPRPPAGAVLRGGGTPAFSGVKLSGDDFVAAGLVGRKIDELLSGKRDMQVLWDQAAPARPETTLPPGTVFRDIDAPWCPELVVIPPGEVLMGATEAEHQWAVRQGATQRWLDHEKPRHLVKIAYLLAVGRFHVTFAEYDHFANTTGRELPGDEGWGRGRRPVIKVSWNDAQAYVEWLASETGRSYRLLSEAEWEYSCRAGKATRFWWGDDISPKKANYRDGKIGKTKEVGTCPANPWGLYDMHGNVMEWVEDCWNYSYEGAPADGSAWTSGDCSRGVIRGGSWFDGPTALRSAYRSWASTVDGNLSVASFRVARTLTR